MATLIAPAEREGVKEKGGGWREGEQCCEEEEGEGGRRLGWKASFKKKDTLLPLSVSDYQRNSSICI